MAENDPLKKVIEWAKKNKQIAIPAAGIAVVGVVFLASKSGAIGGAGNGALPAGTGDPTAAGGGSSDASGGTSPTDQLGQAIADLQNQLIGTQNQNDTAIAALSSQQQGLVGQFQQQLQDLASGLTGQLNGALQGQQSATEQALASLSNQQAGYGDNGLGQLLAQIPQYVGLPQSYESYTPQGFNPAGMNQLQSIPQISQNIGYQLGSLFKGIPFQAAKPVQQIQTKAVVQSANLGQKVGSFLTQLGSLSGYKGTTVTGGQGGASFSNLPKVPAAFNPVTYNKQYDTFQKQLAKLSGYK